MHDVIGDTKTILDNYRAAIEPTQIAKIVGLSSIGAQHDIGNLKRTGDTGLLHEYRDVAVRCLDWIDRYGDLDGDGFQEFKTSSPQGIYNQGWKDSGDAIVYPDGTQVKAPIALCEVQGYVFDAWMRMAEIFTALGDPDLAIVLRQKAARLRDRFEKHFWCEDLGYYAYALDANKQPVKSIVSNPGHCLWSGITSPERAARVVDRLMAPELSIGNATVDLRFWREGDRTCWQADVKEGEIEVQQRSWQPW